VRDEVRLAVDAGLEAERGGGEQRTEERRGGAVGELRGLPEDGQREPRHPVGVHVRRQGAGDLGAHLLDDGGEAGAWSACCWRA
jgi:hypothetical protein